MAAADDEITTIDWIWLSEALELAAAHFRSEKLAKELLREWRASGKLPGNCEVWIEPNAALIAFVEQINRMGKTYLPVAPTAHHKDDPAFWRACTIDWENNIAYVNLIGGAKALGEKVSLTHLLVLLPEAPREREETPEPTKPEEREKLEPKAVLLPEAPREREETPEPTKPEEREKLEPKAALLPEAPREREKAQGSVQWLAADIERMKKAKKISRNITITELSRKLERRMDTAARRDKPIRIRPIKARSIENLLRECGLWPIFPSK